MDTHKCIHAYVSQKRSWFARTTVRQLAIHQPWLIPSWITNTVLLLSCASHTHTCTHLYIYICTCTHTHIYIFSFSFFLSFFLYLSVLLSVCLSIHLSLLLSHFFICLPFFLYFMRFFPSFSHAPASLTPTLCPLQDEFVNTLTGVNRVIAPFLACGDLSAFDSDMTYPLQVK